MNPHVPAKTRPAPLNPTGRCRVMTSVTAGVMLVLHGLPVARADEIALQEIVVTATRRAVSAQDIPISITAVTGATLDQAGIQDIAGLSHSVAGVNYTDKGPYGGITGSTLIIRGLNSEDTSNIAIPTYVVPPVATYVDETPLFFNLRLQDLDRVEILRGPQGTLYGSGSLGGTIRFVQNAPDPNAFDAKAELGISDTKHTYTTNEDVNGMLNLPLSDTLAVRLNASYSYVAGFIDQPNLFVLDSAGVPVPVDPSNLFSEPQTFRKDGTNSYEYQGARIATLWRPSDQFKAQLSYYYQRSSGNGYPYSSPLYGTQSLSNTDNLLETVTDRVDLAALNLEYDMGFATMTSSSSWAQHTNQTLDDGTAIYENFSFYGAYYGANPRAVFPRYGGLDDKLWSQEFRFASKTGGALDWVGGFFFKDQSTNINDHEFYPGYNAFYNACAPVYGTGSAQCGIGEYGPINGVTSIDGISLVTDESYIGDTETKFKDYAIFGDSTVHITSAWTVTGGTRLFDQTVSQSQQTGLLFSGPGYIANNALSEEWRRALWKINTAYQIDKTNLAYATWSQGFRRGIVNALPPAEPAFGYVTPPALNKVEPDTANNYEIGVKGTIENRYQYSAAVYDIEWKNIQEGVSLTPLVLTGAINIGDGYSRGLELEFLGKFTEHLTAQLGYTYDATKLTSIAPLAYVALSTPPPGVGSPLPGTPRNSVALGLEYGGVKLMSGELRFAIDGHYQSSVLPSISETVPYTSGYTILNARTSFTVSHWRTTVYVNNITDSLGISSYNDPGTYGARYSAIVSQPRTVGITIGYSFREY
jgi:iron complex outermembrane receptor protein